MKKFYQPPECELVPLTGTSAILSSSNDALGKLKYDSIYKEDFDELF